MRPSASRFRPGRSAMSFHCLHSYADTPRRIGSRRKAPLRSSSMIPIFTQSDTDSCTFAISRSHAEANGYHVSFATIPLDLWWASQKAVSLFANRVDLLSLLVHGNDHVFRELDRTQSDRERAEALAQALRRVDRFERRYGVPIARVMAPPHGACSHATAAALLRSGFEALCVSRTHPWLDAEPTDDVLAGRGPYISSTTSFPCFSDTTFGRIATSFRFEHSSASL